MSLAPNTKRYEYPVRETTLWEDILVDKNIITPDEKLVQQKEALEASRVRTERSDPSLQKKIAATKDDASKLEELEDELNDDDDERVLAKFREARIQEMKKRALQARFGGVERLARDEFIVQVKEASQKGGLDGVPVHVVVELYREGLDRSQLTSRAVDEVASKNPHIKFVRMVSDQCIQGWPDSRVPCLIVYFNGEMQHQLIGLAECGNGNGRALWKVLAKYHILADPPEEEDVLHRNGELNKAKGDEW